MAGPQADHAVSQDVLTLYAPLLAGLRDASPVDQQVSDLVDEAVRVWSRPGFETFLYVSSLRFTPFDYQMQAARSALRRMRGRAILADEVGLGKTIEAGLILAELRLRGLADRSLVITPAGLVAQWQEELERKFAVPTVTASRETVLVGQESGVSGRGSGAGGIDRPVAVASLATARRDPLRSLLTHDHWDLIIVDEAHRVRAPRSASGKLIRALRSRHLLLLTATPVENRLQDLYEMVSLVAPGLLGTSAQFRAAHGAGGTGPDQEPRNVTALRKRTAEVMIRHRRSEVSVLLPQRLAETLLIEPPAAERDWYADLSARFRAEGRAAAPSARLTLRTVARLAGSSPAAAAPSLRKIGWNDLAARAEALSGSPKGTVLLEQLRRFAGSGEKVLVFTAFRHTLGKLAAQVAAAGFPAAVYHGSLSRAEKERAVAAFRDEVGVLLSTESAGEGRNLQFCHVMVNMDLPWNPMQIEQRLGRLHRVGQEHDVLLTNLVARGTIEEQVLRVLEAKISLFELVVGELDMILGRVADDFDFESTVFDAFVQSGDDAEFAGRMEAIGDDLARARTDYLASRAAIDSLVGEEEG
ncbi:MAG TPA: SNF2-related protein [Streptosporangiaceae bacterium]|jgi:SNF2 family DNA or RNA helicase|nr:SNF2-related protein [Streptosporangiaceae bacterium]